MIYETDTNRVLVYEGAAWVMIADTDNPPGMELVKVQTVGSAVSSVTVTSAFSSTYDVYRIILTGGTGSGTTNITMTLGGVTSGYYGAMFGASWSAGTFQGAGVNNAASWANAGFCTSGYALVDATIYHPTLAINKFISCAWTFNNGGAAYSSFVGELVSTGNLTSFALAPNSATLTGGTIRVYGCRTTI